MVKRVIEFACPVVPAMRSALGEKCDRDTGAAAWIRVRVPMSRHARSGHEPRVRIEGHALAGRR